MKVWILMGAWDYEGHDKPRGVYSTLEKAEAAKVTAYDGYDWWDIYEVEVDAATPWPKDDDAVLISRPAKP